MVKILDEDKYIESTKDGVVFVDFYADWCMPCKMFAPIIDKVSDEIKDVKFFKINVDTSHRLATELGIMSVPTVVIFSGGKIVERFSGVRPNGAISEMLSKYLAK